VLLKVAAVFPKCVTMFRTEVCGVNDPWSTAVEGLRSQTNVDGVKNRTVHDYIATIHANFHRSSHAER
jgi:hypothetical protein